MARARARAQRGGEGGKPGEGEKERSLERRETQATSWWCSLSMGNGSCPEYRTNTKEMACKLK